MNRNENVGNNDRSSSSSSNNNWSPYCESWWDDFIRTRRAPTPTCTCTNTSTTINTFTGVEECICYDDEYDSTISSIDDRYSFPAELPPVAAPFQRTPEISNNGGDSSSTFSGAEYGDNNNGSTTYSVDASIPVIIIFVAFVLLFFPIVCTCFWRYSDGGGGGRTHGGGGGHTSNGGSGVGNVGWGEGSEVVVVMVAAVVVDCYSGEYNIVIIYWYLNSSPRFVVVVIEIYLFIRENSRLNTCTVR